MSAVFGRKVIFVFFVVLELGPDSESLEMLYHLNQSGVWGLGIDSQALGTKWRKVIMHIARSL